MKFKLSLTFGIFTLTVIFIGAIYLHDSNLTKKHNDIIRQLEQNVLPLIRESEITYYLDEDWCKVLEYNGKIISKTIESTSSESCGKHLTGSNDIAEFNNDDQIVFDKIKEQFLKIESESFNGIKPEYALTYLIEHKNFTNEPIGLGFYVNCSFCRTRYVFSPNYDVLPPNIEREIKYTPINTNWYLVEQDWN
jgi:hypothetical protein